jgi:hypothetical protein
LAALLRANKHKNDNAAQAVRDATLDAVDVAGDDDDNDDDDDDDDASLLRPVIERSTNRMAIRGNVVVAHHCCMTANGSCGVIEGVVDSSNMSLIARNALSDVSALLDVSSFNADCTNCTYLTDKATSYVHTTHVNATSSKRTLAQQLHVRRRAHSHCVIPTRRAAMRSQPNAVRVRQSVHATEHTIHHDDNTSTICNTSHQVLRVRCRKLLHQLDCEH